MHSIDNWRGKMISWCGKCSYALSYNSINFCTSENCVLFLSSMSESMPFICVLTQSMLSLGLCISCYRVYPETFFTNPLRTNAVWFYTSLGLGLSNTLALHCVTLVLLLGAGPEKCWHLIGWSHRICKKSLWINQLYCLNISAYQNTDK